MRYHQMERIAQTERERWGLLHWNDLRKNQCQNNRRSQLNCIRFVSSSIYGIIFADDEFNRISDIIMTRDNLQAAYWKMHSRNVLWTVMSREQNESPLALTHSQTEFPLLRRFAFICHWQVNSLIHTLADSTTDMLQQLLSSISFINCV